MRDESIKRKCRAGFKLNIGAYSLAESLVGHAYYRHIGNGRMRAYQPIDGPGTDRLSASKYGILYPAGYAYDALLIYLRQVAALKEAVPGEILLILLG